MRNKVVNIFFITAPILISAAYTSTAAAHTQIGFLGESKKAVDLYEITCFTDGGGVTEHLEASIKDSSSVNPPYLSVTLVRNLKAANTSDKKGGDTSYSPLISLNGGNGIYQAAISKTSDGSKAYIFGFHCKSATGLHTGTSIRPLQNQ
ncbi:MAG: hypothetical protein ACU837_07695 [Gammaproteobacteria bacterium]